MKKFLTVILSLCAVLVFATWQYRLLCVLLVVLLNRQCLKSPAKVILVGGGRDGSCAGIPKIAKQLKNRGTDTAFFYKEDENHYIFAYHSGDIIEFFNREMGLVEE